MKKKILLAVVLILSLSILAYAGNEMRKPKKQETKGERPFKKVEMKIGEIESKIYSDGLIEFDEKEKYYSKTESRIKEVFVSEGDLVKKGDVLISFDTEDLEDLLLNLNQEKLNLQVQELEYKKEKMTDSNEILRIKKNIKNSGQETKSNRLEVSKNNFEMEKLKRDLKEAKIELKTNTKLFEKGYLSQTELDTGKNNVDDFEKEIKNIEFNIANFTIKNEIIKNEIVIYENELKREKNKLNDPKIVLNLQVRSKNMEQTKLKIKELQRKVNDFEKFIKAEKSGVVSLVNAEDNQYVTEEKKLIETANQNSALVKAEITEYDIKLIKEGTKVFISGDAFEKKYKGEISKIYPLTEENSNENTIIPIEISFINLDIKLREGYNVEVEIITSQNKNAIMLPVSVVNKNLAGANFVMVKSKEGLKKTIVETGELDGNYIEIKKGIKKTDKVVEKTEIKSKKSKKKSLFSNLSGDKKRGRRR